MSDSADRPTDAGSEETVRLRPLKTTPVTGFLIRHTLLIPHKHTPFFDEWCIWAEQFETVEEAWNACRDPELLLMMHMAADHGSDPTPVLEILDRFTDHCLRAGGLGPDGLLPFEERTWWTRDLEGCFGPEGRCHWSVARNAAERARRAQVATGEEGQRVRKEQANMLKELLGDPFKGYVGVTDRQFFKLVPEEE